MRPRTNPSRLQAAKLRANRLASLRHHSPVPLRVPTSYVAVDPPEEMPTISIVTPSRNRARFLEQTITSVLGQGYPALEYVVQDCNSVDGSQAILERHADRLHRWESTHDDGQAQALNRGFGHTSGEIMAYLNSDDVLLPGALPFVAGFFVDNPRVDVVYGHRVLIDEAGREIGRHLIPRHRDEVLSWADFIPQETVFWRRSAWEAAGGYIDEEFVCAIDWELLVRLRDAGAKMVRVPRFLGAFRVHGEQKTLTQGSTVGVAEMQRIRERLHGREVSHREALRHVRTYLIRHLVIDRLYRSGLLRY